MQNAHGKAFVFGDDINTDVILPGAYLNVTDPKELASHCMESEDPDFVKPEVKPEPPTFDESQGTPAPAKSKPKTTKRANRKGK